MTTMMNSVDFGGENLMVIGRGDSPALAVLDKNARSLAQRVADETKEELEKVLKRVENIYGNFEVSNNLLESNRAANLEYVNDVAELEDLIRDQVKKKKYQQQVTIFIVGFENVCGQKLRLLQQVNDFFMENAQKLDDDDIRIKSPDLDLDDMAETVDETLKTTEDLAKRLGELNKDMMEYMYNYAQAKASNKGKKKLEKALTQAKDDMNNLNEQLHNLKQEIEEKEDKMQQMFKQVELKNMEVQRYKTAAEVAKKSHEETDKLRGEITVRDEKIKALIKELEKLQQEMTLTNHTKERSQDRLLNAREESNVKLEQLQQSMQDQTLLAEEAKRDLSRLHKKQVGELEAAHTEELQQLQLQHNEEIKKLLGEEASKAALYEIDAQGSLATESTRSESRQNQDESRDPEESQETVEEPAKPAAQQKPELVPLNEDEILEFDNIFGLDDEESWATVPPEAVRGRFGQYRRLAYQELEKLREQVDTTIKRTTKKINTLKGQFQEHKAKWESEKQILKSQIEQVGKLQNAAETEADKAMTQLEDFINEQEKLEIQEEQKQRALEEMAKAATASDISGAVGQEGATQTAEAAPQAKEEQNEVQEVIEQRLLEQTDDAKMEMSRKASAKHVTSDTQTDEQSHAGERTGTALSTTESIRQSSARSRASLRSQHRSTLSAMRTAQEERRSLTRASTHHSMNKSLITDAELDEDGDMPFPEDKPVLTVDRVSSSHDVATSMSLHDQGTSPMTPQLLYTKTPSLHEDRTSRSSTTLPHASTMITTSTSTQNESPPIPKRTLSPLPAQSMLKIAQTDTSHVRPPGVDLPTTVNEMADEILQIDGEGIPMAEHPIVEEYIKTYDNIVSFKDVLAKTFLERDLMSPGSVLSDIEPVPFDKDNTIQPQLEQMTVSVQKILQEILSLVNNMLTAERDYPVSSLNLSREPTRLTHFTPDSAYGGGTLTHKTTTPSVSSTDIKTQQQIEELQKMIAMMEQNMNAESRKYEGQLQHNAVMMMEMQDTIDSLQRELIDMKSSSQAQQTAQQIPEDTPIMFTRLDSERNAKVMKRALNERRLSNDTYENAVKSMDSYVSLPARRLAHLVTKYVHHRQMKQIEERVQKSQSLDHDVFEVLDKMETMQSVRAQRWADQMDAMGAERMRLATMLMETLGDIERESGIFLIKPVYSYKPTQNAGYDGKVSRRFKPTESQTTPASHIRTVQQLQHQSLPSNIYNQIRQEEESGMIQGKAKNLIGEYPKPVWQPSTAITHQTSDNISHRFNSHLNTPKMLELDINRMLIGQNQITMRTTPGLESDDRLANAANQTTRSYVTVNRPSGQPNGVQTTRPRSHPSGTDQTSVPPTTPYTKSLPNSAGRKVRMAEEGGARQLNPSPPLPPITPNSDRPLSREVIPDDIPYPPRSPPGSSMRQSTTPVHSVTPHNTRPSTQSGTQVVSH